MAPKQSLGFLTLLLLVASSLHARPNLIFSPTEVSATIHTTGFIESTQTMDAWKWHTKGQLEFVFLEGDDAHLVQARQSIALGFGLPKRLELNIALPLGYTFATYGANGFKGPGVGDLRIGILSNLVSAPQGGIGLTVGAMAYIPTGSNEQLLGEGYFSLLGFVAGSVSLFSSALTLNIGYHARKERHGLLVQGDSLEQDDELIWRVGLRVPKDEDIAWTLGVQNRIGVATSNGFRPSAQARPLWIGAGIDYPTFSQHRLGLWASFLASGNDRGFAISVQLSGVAKDKDEDLDGVLLPLDQCPLLREDLDGYQDSDGCPDLDNDMDSFPDKEDECPLQPGDEFSDNGC